MFKKIIWTGLLSLSVLSSSAFGQDKTVVNDAPAKTMLLGRHKLSLQWISWDYFGAATIANRGGVLYLKGSQRGKGNSDLLTIDGVITQIDAREFSFSGKIVTKIRHINGGRPCEREGDFTFRITGKRKYWRMQEINNSCDEAADYVDIYFR